ncbi:MAG: hypothetical protein ACTSWX_11620 [Promethearchaeota archaeon]
MKLVKEPKEIIKLLNSINDNEKILGYKSFLNRTHWFSAQTPEALKNFACNQMQVNPRYVLATFKRIEPAFLWASQDSLESEKLKMVEAAYNYVIKIKEEIPPIIVWNFFDSQKIRLIVHDGHHRSFFFYRFHKKVNAVILEPLGNYHQMEEKFNYAFQIRKRVIDLPVIREKH